MRYIGAKQTGQLSVEVSVTSFRFAFGEQTLFRGPPGPIIAGLKAPARLATCLQWDSQSSEDRPDNTAVDAQRRSVRA